MMLILMGYGCISDEPYKIPEKYKGKFPKGTTDIDESIGYIDFALKRFFIEAKSNLGTTTPFCLSSKSSKYSGL